ncbi:MAG: hypothetical protein A2660_03215 [Candidatus Doudnabacteria bacterium RIFCSPHIGHO2_01_FULL_45_18]|uniref:PBCV-specific basic adaptor domain-containing protein n=1 Tax=Candidatus Doudnabacteria bacterium RIFCSPHIGHO2_01_FULL_45_18 TaxID=1817823 RepID=A0A1F5NS59_9BACT|nr:MAG: hypothetical protein A2660_03215 [Candidatus Doudnabacteria bacterium RIFCSPHIGHO2_01_FULL_45_18]
MKIKAFISSLLVAVVLLGSLSFAEAKVKVKGYTKQSGTYVQPYIRTSPNKTKLDNYSTKGNINPYTGKKGTVSPYKAPKITPYKAPKTTTKKK